MICSIIITETSSKLRSPLLTLSHTATSLTSSLIRSFQYDTPPPKLGTGWCTGWYNQRQQLDLPLGCSGLNQTSMVIILPMAVSSSGISMYELPVNCGTNSWGIDSETNKNPLDEENPRLHNIGFWIFNQGHALTWSNFFSTALSSKNEHSFHLSVKFQNKNSKCSDNSLQVQNCNNKKSVNYVS